MPRPVNAPPPTPEWSESEYLIQNQFEQFAQRRVELKMIKDELEKELKDLDLQLSAMLATADMKSVRYGMHRLTLSYSTKGGKLDKTKLLENGVTVAQLEASITPKEPGASYMTVTEIKGAED